MGARRIDVTWFGKAGTFGLLIAFPLFLAHESSLEWWQGFAWLAGIPGLVLSLYAAVLYVPMARRALAERRAEQVAAVVGRVDATMKAVIMAGGEGSRLRPLTSNQPKPMLPLVNRPMMEHIVGLLRRHGFDEIVVTLAFMPNVIRNYFGDGSEFGVRMVYATEEHPLGTAGSVRNAMDELDERFLVISGDVLTDIDLGKIVAFHEERSALATIGLVAVENPLEFGIVITRDDGSIERFLEKPTWGQVFSDTINTGIFVLEPEIFDYIDADRPVDFSSEVFPALLEAGKPLYGAVAEGYWEDVGTLEAYVRAHKDVLDGKVELDIPGFRLSDGVWLGEGAEIHPDATIDGPAVIGDALPGRGRRPPRRVHRARRQRPGAGRRRPRAGRRPRQRLPRPAACACGAPSSAGPATCATTSAARRASSSATSASSATTPCSAPGVKVYPFKTVEHGAVVNSSIVWESRGARILFGRDGVAGLANVDISPELAAKLAMAWGTTLKKGSTVITSRDSSRSARMLKRAMMAGLNACGRQRARPRDGVGAGHPVPDPPAHRQRPAATRAPRRGRPAVGRDPLLRHRGPRPRRGRPAQDRAAVQPGGLPPGVPRRDRRHRVPAPGPRDVHRRPRGHRRHRRPGRRHASRSSSTTATAAPAS